MAKIKTQEQIDVKFDTMCEKYRKYYVENVEKFASIPVGYGMRAYSRFKHFSTRKEDN